MSTVKAFFESLSDGQKDLFVSMTTDLQASAPQDKIERLQTFHGQLKHEIDSINKRRQGLGETLNNVESLHKVLSKYVETNGNNLELTMFLGALQKVSADLKAEIAAIKPEKKLAKKFDVARRMESLRQRQALSLRLFSDVLKAKDPEEDPEPVKAKG